MWLASDSDSVSPVNIFGLSQLQQSQQHSKVYDENYNADEKTPIDEFDAMVDDAGMPLGDDDYNQGKGGFENLQNFL